MIAEKRREEEEKEKEEGSFLQPERLAEGWRLRAAVRREAGRISAVAERERERERHTERGVCGRTRGYYSTGLNVFGVTERPYIKKSTREGKIDAVGWFTSWNPLLPLKSLKTCLLSGEL
ncbi:hypothetical protein FQN60_008631, partial [Etheostoma spectabile]